ncbi:MAG: type II secretion system protein, partial [Chloroflexi bacterium]|nr:type II secretion system protein [Chloroflexota bacterium]
MIRPPRHQSGFSLIELTVVLAISAFVLTALAAVVAQEIRVPVKIQSEAEATRQVQRATLLLTEDANVAQSFTAGTSTVYGTFKWFEFSGVSPIAVSSRYFWSDQKVFREVTRGGETSAATVVLDPVATSTDVTFTYVPTAWTY